MKTTVISLRSTKRFWGLTDGSVLEQQSSHNNLSCSTYRCSLPHHETKRWNQSDGIVVDVLWIRGWLARQETLNASQMHTTMKQETWLMPTNRMLAWFLWDKNIFVWASLQEPPQRYGWPMHGDLCWTSRGSLRIDSWDVQQDLKGNYCYLLIAFSFMDSIFLDFWLNNERKKAYDGSSRTLSLKSCPRERTTRQRKGIDYENQKMNGFQKIWMTNRKSRLISFLSFPLPINMSWFSFQISLSIFVLPAVSFLSFPLAQRIWKKIAVKQDTTVLSLEDLSRNLWQRAHICRPVDPVGLPFMEMQSIKENDGM